MKGDENPFVRFELDPSAPLAASTSRLRERMEDASTDEERAALRRAWEALSRSPARRLELALEAGPMPDALPEMPEPVLPQVAFEPALADLLAPPPLAPMLPPETNADRAQRRIGLSFLVRDDEIAITGALVPARRAR